MTTRQCPQCSTEIPDDAPGGVCPRCLLALGMRDNPASGSQAATSGAANGSFFLPEIEQLIGRFPNLEIEHLIGHGGMGAVYRARQTNLDRTVALKILSPQLNADPAFAERFTREARTLARLTHPNIVTVFDFGQSESMHYLVMEYVDGVNLRDAIESTSFAPVEALAVIGQICDALQYAHDQGIVHRDIKPENILVNTGGLVKIADFGLAKLLGPTQSEFTLTHTRQVLGTLKYMAPEQIERPERVDHRADLYSLGVVFYELLTGELPIGRFAVPSAKAEVNQRLDDVVLKTLEKEPDHRFQHASEIKTAVEAANLASATDRLGEDSRQPRFSSVPALPFKTDDLYGGMAKGYGIARIRDAQTLEVEVEIQDFLGATKSPAKTVAVPIARLSSINFKPGVFSDTVSAQAETMTAVTDIPGAKRGLMKMYTSKSDSEIARQFVESVRQLLPSNRAGAQRVVAPTAPIKKGTADAPSMVPIRQEDRNALAENLRVPMVGMWITGLLHLGLAFFLILVLLRGALNRPDQFDSLFDSVLRALGEFLHVANTTQIIWSAAISLGFAVLLFGVAWHLYRQRGYSLAFAGSILLVCTPIHPLALATLPLGIWALVVLDRPIARQIFRDQSFMTALPHRGSVGFAWRWLVVAGLLFVLFAGGMGIILTSIAYTSTRVSESAESATVTMVAEQQSGQVVAMRQPTGTVRQDPVNPAPPAAPATTVQSERVQISPAGFILISLVAGAMAVVALVAVLITVLWWMKKWWMKKREPSAGLSGRN